MTQNKALRKLVEISGPALVPELPELDPGVRALAGPLANELLQLLSEKNGFYAFESALHVFPDRPYGSEVGLNVWNSNELWKGVYRGMADGCLFFAEDVFGCQFCIREGEIHTFDPETGQLERVSGNIEGWAEALLGDYQVLTGYPLAHEWQTRNGPIPAGKRLVPKLPFVVGGEFTIANMLLLDSVKGMRLRGEIAIQIKDLPDGAKVKFEIVD